MIHIEKKNLLKEKYIWRDIIPRENNWICNKKINDNIYYYEDTISKIWKYKKSKKYIYINACNNIDDDGLEDFCYFFRLEIENNLFNILQELYISPYSVKKIKVIYIQITVDDSIYRDIIFINEI